MSLKKKFLFCFCGALLLGGLFSYFRPEALSQASLGKKKKELAIPVVSAVVEARDFPIYLEGIGTVEPFNSVLIRPRVDGTLDKVVFNEGDNIKQGDLLGVIDARPYQAQLDQAIAKKNQDQASLNNATVALERSTDLIQKNVLSQQDFDKARFLVDQYKALVAADQAALENAETQLSYTQITSPIAGRAGVRLIDQGNIVHARDVTGLVLINQMQPISVLFTLPEKDLLMVQEQMRHGPLSVMAFDRDDIKQLETGVLAVVDNQIDQTTGTVKLKATFSNADLSLWPGQFVNCRLLLKTLPGALVVPAPAIQRGPQGVFVYVIDAEQKVDSKKVTLGESDAGFIIVKNGLQLGEKVVVDGQYKLKPGSLVSEAAPSKDQ